MSTKHPIFPNPVFAHPGQPEMQAQVILASKGPDNPPLFSVRMRYPRPIHAELMTHRVFCRNARSSRAVPVKTMLEEVRNTPFVPWHWGKNQKGMQAGGECNELVLFLGEEIYSLEMQDRYGVDLENQCRAFWLSREDAWIEGRDRMADLAEVYMNAGYHKQIANRLLEPFMWIDVLVTATDWANFFHLRDHPDAEPHLQDLARLVRQAIEAAEPKQLEPGQWHLPYITKEDSEESWWLFCNDIDPVKKQTEYLCKISAARCARISYKPFDGDASYERELARYEQLVGNGAVHATPLEHQATPDEWLKSHEGPYGEWRTDRWQLSHLHGPLRGWIQFRKTIPNEAVHG